jgi:hypothetical protein
VLKNTAKGNFNEAKASKFYHNRYTPVLISSSMLRKYNCAQVDISFVKDNTIYLGEVKSSKVGISKRQMNRLKDSAEFISAALDVNTQILPIISCQMH